MNESKEKPTFSLGQRVRVVINDRNRTAHVGSIREMIWHHKEQKYNYYLEENGKNISKRYDANDLETIV